MFKTLFSPWRGDYLLNQALNETEQMLSEVEKMFSFALGVLMEGKPDRMDIYKMDRSVNQYEIDIRKKVLEHLTINPKQDITASLVLTSIVIDIERIGDFSKNLIELAHMYPEKLEKSKYVEDIKEIETEVLENFRMTKRIFSEADAEKGRQLMGRHAQLAKRCDRMLEELINDDKISPKEAVAFTLLTRYLKRVSAHLKNVASSVVNPFHRIGFKPE